MEQWRPVPGWEKLYEVSDHGRVRSIPRRVPNRHGFILTKAHILTPSVNERGYLRVVLSDVPRRIKHPKVHRLVFAAFNPDVKFTELNHRDLDKTNNRLDNIEPSSRKHNQAHAAKNGAYRVKLSANDIIEMRRLREQEKCTQAAIARKFNVTRRYVKDIVNYRVRSN